MQELHHRIIELNSETLSKRMSVDIIFWARFLLRNVFFSMYPSFELSILAWSLLFTNGFIKLFARDLLKYQFVIQILHRLGLNLF